MATTVTLEPNRTFDDIGEGFAKGFNIGVEETIKKKETSERNRRMNVLLKRASSSPDKESAMQIVAEPEFADLFDTFEKVKSFGGVVEGMFENPDDAEQTTAEVFTVDGKEVNAILTATQKANIANAPDKKIAMREALGLPEGMEVSLGAVKAKNMVDIIDSRTGKTIRQVIKNTFDPAVDLGENEVTAADFTRGMSLLSASAAEKKNRNAANKEAKPEKLTDAGNRAEGVNNRRGIVNSKENRQKTMAILEQSDKFTDRLQSVFGLTKETNIEKFSGSGMDQRVSIAVPAMQDLMFEGLTGSQAFKAARTIGKGITVTKPGSGFDDGSKTIGPVVEVPQLTPESVTGLTRADIGKVLKGKSVDGRQFGFYVVTGIASNGEPETKFIGN